MAVPRPDIRSSAEFPQRDCYVIRDYPLDVNVVVGAFGDFRNSLLSPAGFGTGIRVDNVGEACGS